MFHTEKQLYTLPGCALQVCVVVGGWWGWVGVESEFSDSLWLRLSLGQAEHLLSIRLI